MGAIFVSLKVIEELTFERFVEINIHLLYFHYGEHEERNSNRLCQRVSMHLQ